MESIEIIKKECNIIIEYLEKEVASLRAGRATPALVEGIKVSAYGSISDIQHVASISTPDPKIIFIQPWDKALIEPIQKALTEARLGMQPVVQENKILLSLPVLTHERREEILKMLGKKVEEARVKIRQRREKMKSMIEDAEKKKEISEDEKFRQLKELQKVIDEYAKKVESIESRKRKEIES